MKIIKGGLAFIIVATFIMSLLTIEKLRDQNERLISENAELRATIKEKDAKVEEAWDMYYSGVSTYEGEYEYYE